MDLVNVFVRVMFGAMNVALSHASWRYFYMWRRHMVLIYQVCFASDFCIVCWTTNIRERAWYVCVSMCIVIRPESRTHHVICMHRIKLLQGRKNI